MKILAVQSRKGIGDNIIFLPFIKALSNKFNSPISLLVKESSKADQYLHQTNYIDKIITLERNSKNNLKKFRSRMIISNDFIEDSALLMSKSNSTIFFPNLSEQYDGATFASLTPENLY